MEYKDLIAARHSVRKFTDRKIDRATLEQIVSEASLAPSSKNSKSSEFIIVDDPAALEALSGMRDRGSALLKGAAAAIIVLGDTTKTDLWVDNASISATYIMLSATDKGLGSCWVHVNGRPRIKSDPGAGSAEDCVREVVGFAPELRPLCIVALGYEASEN